jgi:hypothetical protein
VNTRGTSLTDFTAMWVHQAPLAEVLAAQPQLQQQAATDAPLTQAASCWTYDAGGFAGSICSAPIVNVQPGSAAQYRVGCDSLGWSTWRTMRSPPPANGTLKVLAVADMGIAWSNQTIALMNAEAQTGAYGAVWYTGDMGYANDYGDSNNSWVFDEFFNAVEPHLDGAAGPWVPICGNHEDQFHFAAYLNRTAYLPGGPGPNGRFYYVAHLGPVTLISFSTEHDVSPGSEIYQFVEASLKNASDPTSRSVRPWIAVATHHPFLCTDALTWSSRCSPSSDAGRFRGWYERMFHQYGVDIFFSGHNHMMEASWPYYNGTFSTDLHNSYQRGTVYVVNGAGGSIEGIEPFFMPDQPSRMFDTQDSLDTVYARLTVNTTSFTAEFVDAHTGNVAHSFQLTRD